MQCTKQLQNLGTSTKAHSATRRSHIFFPFCMLCLSGSFSLSVAHVHNKYCICMQFSADEEKYDFVYNLLVSVLLNARSSYIFFCFSFVSVVATPQTLTLIACGPYRTRTPTITSMTQTTNSHCETANEFILPMLPAGKVILLPLGVLSQIMINMLLYALFSTLSILFCNFFLLVVVATQFRMQRVVFFLLFNDNRQKNAAFKILMEITSSKTYNYFQSLCFTVICAQKQTSELKNNQHFVLKTTFNLQYLLIHNLNHLTNEFTK